MKSLLTLSGLPRAGRGDTGSSQDLKIHPTFSRSGRLFLGRGTVWGDLDEWGAPRRGGPSLGRYSFARSHPGTLAGTAWREDNGLREGFSGPVPLRGS